MKYANLFSIALLSAAFVMAGCSSKSHSGGGGGSSADDKPAVKKEYLSNDLAMFDLYGQVKTVEGFDPLDPTPFEKFDYQKNIYQFDEKGVCNKYNFTETEDRGIVYNADGRMISVRYPGDLQSHDIKWDDKGHVIEVEDVMGSTMSNSKYTYNEDGDIVKAVYNSAGMQGYEYQAVVTYEITKRDDHGNWTERNAKYDIKESHWDWDVEDQVSEDRTENKVEKRVITYYDGKSSADTSDKPADAPAQSKMINPNALPNLR